MRGVGDRPWPFPLLAILLLLAFWPAFGSAQQPKTDTPQVYVVPLSHLDLSWACTQDECLSRGNFIVSKAIQLAEQNPENRYVIESEAFVANFAENHRGTRGLDQLKQLVKNGRIEIAPLWDGIYQNQARGEALVRNLI